MYRVKYGKHYGSTSTSEWKYYEDVSDNMKVDLLEAFMEQAQRNGRHNWLMLRMCWAWMEARRFVLNVDEPKFKTDRVYEIAKLVNDEWVPVTVTFHAPYVKIMGEAE